jgi:hypothetical protein
VGSPDPRQPGTRWLRAKRRDTILFVGASIHGDPHEPFNTQTWGTTWDPAAAPTLDVDALFNMPYLADDMFVRNFATYVREHLERGRPVPPRGGISRSCTAWTSR